MHFQFKRHYEQDIQLWTDEHQARRYAALLTLLVALPVVVPAYLLSEIALIGIYAIAGLGLMILTGYTGLVSLGHAAFLGIGGYVYAIAATAGWPAPLAALAAVCSSSAAGLLVGLPVLRLNGVYLAIATLAASIVVEQVLAKWSSVTGGFDGIAVPQLLPASLDIQPQLALYYVVLLAAAAVVVLVLNILRTPLGRALCAIRDSEISAKSLGIPTARYKVIAFTLSAGVTGLAGALLACYLQRLSPATFGIMASVQLILMIIIGGVGSVHGAFFGAVFVSFVPQLLAACRDYLPARLAQLPGLEPGVFGLLLIFFLIMEPDGLYGRFRKIWSYFDQFPLYKRAAGREQRSYSRTERIH